MTDASTVDGEIEDDMTSVTETSDHSDHTCETSKLTETVSVLSVTEETDDHVFTEPAVPTHRNHAHCHHESRRREAPSVTGSSSSHGSHDSDWHRDPKYGQYWRQQERAWHWYRQHVNCTSGLGHYASGSAWPGWAPPGGGQYYGNQGMNSVSVGAWKRYHAACIEWLEQYEDWMKRRQRRHVSVTSTMTSQTHSDGATSQTTETCDAPSPVPHHGKRKNRKKHMRYRAKKRRPDQRRKSLVISDTPQISDIDGSLEVRVAADGEEVVKMEITPEMLDFFAQSAKHRQEREAEKLERGSDEDHVELDEVPLAVKKTTVKPPSERPGVRRTTEMKELYGAASAMIHGMETAMQLNFDRNCDLKQPKLWPNLPLTIKFK